MRSCRRRTSTSRSSPAALLNRLATRLYFDGDPALAEDPVLKLVEPARRDTLIARRDAGGAWRLPIHLGGPRETVFFDV